MTEEEQDTIAALVLDEVEDEARWDEAFARSHDALARLAEQALEKDRAGRTTSRGRFEFQLTMDLTPIAIPVTLHRYLRALLAGGICWLGIPLPGQATVDMASSPGSAVGDPLYAEVARIEQYGTQYVLTSYCHGTHSIYVQPTTEFDLRDYAGKYVRVAYEHIEVQEADIKCVRAPCGPVTVTKAVILKLERIDMSEADLEESRRSCSQP